MEEIMSLETAEAILEEYGSDLHPILEDPKNDVFEPSPPPRYNTFSQTTFLQAEKFLDSMDKHRSHPKHGCIQIPDLRAKYSWNEMIESAKNAESAYDAAGSKPLRKTGRWISAHSESTFPVLNLIPNGFYTSILYGGLKLVFESFTQLDERRLRVMKSFLKIPNTIIHAEDCIRIFSSDEELGKRAELVFCAALPAIEDTISWLRQNPAKKQIRALLHGPAYNKDFKEKIQNLDDALSDLEQRVSVLRTQTIQKTGETVENVELILKRADTHLSVMDGDIKTISKIQGETRVKVDNLHDLEQVRKEAKKAMKIAMKYKIRTSRWMKQQHEEMRQQGEAFSRLKKQFDEYQKAEMLLTQAEFLDILDVSPSFANDDLRRIQNTCQFTQTAGYQTIKNLMDGDQMSEWLMSDVSSEIFIEGSTTCALSRTTILSHLSSELIKHLRDTRAVPIYFFCGQHTSSTDPMRGPRGIMRSLIQQVLRTYSPELDFMTKGYRKQLEALHLYTLCDCFYKLIRRLPDDALIVCIIDGISFFEKKEWVDECKEMISVIQRLLEKDEDKIFKLLVTSPLRSHFAGEMFSPEFRITIHEDDSNFMRQAPTEREIAMANIRPMRSDANSRQHPTSLRERKRQLRQVLASPSATSRSQYDYRSGQNSESESDSNSDSDSSDEAVAKISKMDVDSDASEDEKSLPQPSKEHRESNPDARSQ